MIDQTWPPQWGGQSTQFSAEECNFKITMVMAPSRATALELLFSVSTVSSGAVKIKDAEPDTLALFSAVRL